MSTAVLSLGSNMGDPAAQLATAVRQLGSAVRAVSSLYRTPPWGPVPQDDYLNLIVIVADDEVDARGWLKRCHDLERAAGRRRTVRWGPRTLDADVVVVHTGRRPHADTDADTRKDSVPVLSDDPELTLPHPRAAERAFVLVPWAEVDPGAELPGHGPILELLRGLDRTGVHLVGRVPD